MNIPIVQMTPDGLEARRAAKPYSDCRPLPASYMSEYSVLGLLVDKLLEAARILRLKGFQINTEIFGAEVCIGSPGRLPEIAQLLEDAGVYCSITDVIDSVYQG